MNKVLTIIAFLLSLSTLYAQTSLSGLVTDEQGQPLPGASVLVTETKQGTVTGSDGRYLIGNLQPGIYQLRFSFVGFQPAMKGLEVPQNQLSISQDVALTPTAILLDALTVRATRAGEKSPFTYSIVSREALNARNLGQDVPFLLDATPSAVVTSDAGAGIGYTGIRIRGTDPTRINVTINGVPLNDAESHNVFWVDLPDFAASTQDIQIQRGAGASTNGAGAFGATINLRTDELQLEPESEISLGAGSFGTRRAMAKFGTGLLGKKAAAGSQPTGYVFDGRLSRILSDGYIERASADLKSFHFSGAWLGEHQSLRAHVFSGHEITYQAWNGVPAQWVDDEKLRRFNVSGTEKPGKPYADEVDNYQQTHAQLVYNHSLDRRWHLNLTGHYTRGYGFFEQYKADESPSRYLLPEQPCPDSLAPCEYDYIRRRWLDNHFLGGIGALHFNSDAQRWQATFSTGWNRYLGDHYGEIIWGEGLEGAQPGHRYYFGTGDKSDYHVFAKGQYEQRKGFSWHADLQYRLVTYEITGTDNDLRETNADLNYGFFNPKLGWFWDINAGWSASSSFAVAHREPNRNDFTDAPAGQRPRPERLYNTEASLQYRQGGKSFGLNLYHMHYRDQLVLTGNINDVGAPIRTNVPESYRLGLELTARVPLVSRFSLDWNATLSRNKILDFTEYRDNWDTWEQEVIGHGTTDIAFSPELIAFGRLSWEAIQQQRQQLTLSLGCKHVGQQFIDNTSNAFAVLDAYTVGELQLRWVLRPAGMEELSFNLLINNLFGARYSANAWTYRYISASYDARPDDPYARLEEGDRYNLTGYFPQAGRNVLLGVTARF
ncbi:MAG: hypothetical protein RI973_1707 [Bacteroidota bacterium]|jgi:iron complex outermembrane receptor protein